MDDYFSERNFMKRLEEKAINISDKRRKKFIILEENKKYFPELKLTSRSAKDLFQVNGISSIITISKTNIIDYVYVKDRLDLGCTSTYVHNYIMKMAYRDKKAIVELLDSLPDDYRKAFMKIKDDVAKEISAIGSQPAPLKQSSVVAEEIVKRDCAEFFVEATKKLGLMETEAVTS